ncbi:MAG: homocysteine S-methyltransferase family protein [Cyclobacteriaceae bacterium]|nr:homocysteine S-methyltransferase family protein [Cyclobacteriaceae bacterium]
MAKYRTDLPQLTQSTFMTDGGLETTLIFNQGIDLPHFASFDQLKNVEGRKILKDYYQTYLDISKHRCGGFILEAPTWRANPDWAKKIGYSLESLDRINRVAIQELEDIRGNYEHEDFRMPISGCIGPRGDGYSPENLMSRTQAEEYHAFQIRIFADTNADLVSAMTLNYNDEAVGIVKAAKNNDIPVVISYTVETDGRLPSGESLDQVITSLDKITDNYTSYFMINCAHPSHFSYALQSNSAWTSRIKGIRANASVKSHAELDESETLDEGNKEELALGYKNLKSLLPNLNIIGGCCGTDHTHMEKICELWFKE